MSNITPMMKQYLEIKEQYKDAILFFRLGDFYEMFFEDALVASKILEIALTGKSYGAEERAPMCGVPFHSAENYIQKLIHAGKKVAICEQVEDPKLVKGIVKREVVKIITPGTNVNDNTLEGYQDSYLMCIDFDQKFKAAYIDVTTGEINVTSIENDALLDFVTQIQPKEILFHQNFLIGAQHNKSLQKEFRIIQSSYTTTMLDDYFDGAARAHLAEHINAELEEYLPVLNMILGYIQQTQGIVANNITRVNIAKRNNFLRLDPNTKKNLELTENATTRQKKNTLFDILDYSVTSVGKRTLRKWIDNPLNDVQKINERLDLVEELNLSFDLRSDLKELFDEIYDMERITGKMSYGNLSTRDAVALRSSLFVLPSIIKRINDSQSPCLKNLIKSMDDLSDIHQYLLDAVVDEPSVSIKDGEVIRSEYNENLKEYRFLEKNSAAVLQQIETNVRERLGVKSLKVGYNKVFGYYFEITHTASREATIPSDFIRKQTLSNAERYINQELKEMEDKILGARQKIFEIQSEIFDEIKNVLSRNILRINQTAEQIGIIDALLSLSIASIERNMVRPKFNNKRVFEIEASRHPVIENILGEDHFVPNDIIVNQNSRIQIITGPNMGGKSTYMRQAAIIAIMAHMGSFVTAKSANLPVLDAIFTRVGASDDLSLGQSTFMVEMKEVSHIIKNATENSLIILDEVGRGTSTFDGMSIAWALIEYFSEKINSTTLFSTHYHEITELENLHDNIQNFYIAVNEDGNDIRFLHKIMKGKMDKSYGIHVANIAGIPAEILSRANEKLKLLEKNELISPQFFETRQTDTNRAPVAEESTISASDNKSSKQMSFEDYSSKEILERLDSLDMDDVSPRAAFQILEELQRIAKERIL